MTVRVGSVYFVDDQRSRDGRDAYWEVMIFDAKWHRLSGYGAGADNPEALPNTTLHRGRERPRVSARRVPAINAAVFRIPAVGSS